MFISIQDRIDVTAAVGTRFGECNGRPRRLYPGTYLAYSERSYFSQESLQSHTQHAMVTCDTWYVPHPLFPRRDSSDPVSPVVKNCGRRILAATEKDIAIQKLAHHSELWTIILFISFCTCILRGRISLWTVAP